MIVHGSARKSIVHGAEDVGQLSMHVPLFAGVDGQHEAPLADVAEWLSQNLQNDVQVENMASSPTHASRWGPLAPAGIVESEPSLSAANLPHNPCATWQGSCCTYAVSLVCSYVMFC